MKVQSVKGTRDLYPEDYAPIRRIFDVWRSVSLRHGFVEYEGPTLEYLDLYREKSGDELVGQLFRLTDAGGRELALRPEMTPTLARMVAARINALPRPIKWFSIPTLFRGENVQRGRLREFYQWNIDVIGSAEPAADAECILVGVEAMRELGLTAADVAVHVSSRTLIAAIFEAFGIEPGRHGAAYALLDKVGRLDETEMTRRWDEAFGAAVRYETLWTLLGAADLAALRGALASAGAATPAVDARIAELEALTGILHDFGILEFCNIDLRIVRGLAYYTGVVFEFFDRAKRERALCGGGRYDDLLGKLGKSSEPAVGFGMGDVVLSLMLADRNLLRGERRGGGVLVAEAEGGPRSEVHRIAAALRRGGIAAEFVYQPQPLGKQLKTADKRGVDAVVIVGPETAARGVVAVKNMAGGQTREIAIDAVLKDPAGVLGRPA